MAVTTVTIATHMGHQVAREHSKRNRKVTDKEGHIRKDGDYAIWADCDPKVAYDKIFGKAVADYNARQKRSDRKIENYYKSVCKDAKKHPVYECIVGVYPKNGKLSKQEQKLILNEYAQGWAQANPHLCLIGCYYHADEAGEPHIHLDYIPWSDGYKNGPERQAGLVRALEAQGFHKQGRETAQMQWTQAENRRLEAICKAHGLEVVHPMRGQHAKHIATKDYKYHKEQLELLRKAIQTEKKDLDAKAISSMALDLEIGNRKKQLDRVAAELQRAVGTVEQFQNCEDVFQWMENQANRNVGKTVLQVYCENQGLDYEYWVKAIGIVPNPAGGYGHTGYDYLEQ